MKSNAFISVIIPIYNSEKYLAKCIESILSQTFKNFELILINDGSKDNSLDICNKYKNRDKRISIINSVNKGVSNARNLGIEKSKGEWIIFCDSDDWVENTWLESYVKYFNSGVDIIFQGYILENESGEIISIIKHNTNNLNSTISKIIYLEQSDMIGYSWIKIFKRELIISYNIRFDVSISHSEDLIFTLDYLSKSTCNIAIAPMTNYHYVRHSGSLISKSYSYNNIAKRLNKVYNARKKLCSKYSDLSYETWTDKQYINGLLDILKKTSKSKNDKSLNTQIINCILLLRPQYRYFSKFNAAILWLINKKTPLEILSLIFYIRNLFKYNKNH